MPPRNNIWKTENFNFFLLHSFFSAFPSGRVQVARFLSEEVRPQLEPYKAKMEVKIELEI